MEYQSLYRRYRPGRFSDVKGQEHVRRTIQNAVREERVGHAYLLSGPRGTGKTTTARLLAKVLNCQNVTDGEPCCECDSCVAVESGSSFDLHELDAASNNKVDDIRDLLAKVALGTPGRNKVYLLDEVHMLTPGAENALLKTLEEPPAHVTFVLATTEPHKVVPTIRSRTQHLELTLLSAETLRELVTEISADAGLEVDEEMIEYVIRAGGGSARDTLSALDQVVAAGGVGVADTSTADLLEALASSDAAMALSAVSDATNRGIDPRVIGEQLIAVLREVFLVAMGSEVPQMSASDGERAASFAKRMPASQLTRSLELIGTSLVEMRQAPDPRIDLEVALVKLTRADADSSVDALAVRVAKLEQALASGTPMPAAAAPQASAAQAPPAQPTPPAAAPPVEVVPAEPTRAEDPGAVAPPPVPAAAPVDPEPPAASTAGGPAAMARATLAAKLGRPGAASAPVAPAPVEAAAPPPSPPPVDPGLAPAPPPPPAQTERVQTEPVQTEPVQAETAAPAPPEALQPDAAPLTPEAAAPVGESAGFSDGTPLPDEPSDFQPAYDDPESEPAAVAEAPAPAPAPGGPLPTTGEMAAVWKENILTAVSGKARSRFSIAEFVSSDGPKVVVNFPNEVHRKRCEEVLPEVEQALATHFGRPVPLDLVSGHDGGQKPDGSDVGSGPGPAPKPKPAEPAAVELEDEEMIDVSELVDAPNADGSVIDQLTKAFPGAELIQDE